MHLNKGELKRVINRKYQTLVAVFVSWENDREKIERKIWEMKEKFYILTENCEYDLHNAENTRIFIVEHLIIVTNWALQFYLPPQHATSLTLDCGAWHKHKTSHVCRISPPDHRPTAAGAAAGRDKNEAKEDDCEDKHMDSDVWYLHSRHISLFSQSITSLAMKGKGSLACNL